MHHPPDARHRDPQLITRALDIALRGIFVWQRRGARRAGAVGPRTGAVTFVQRFGGALNLNVHFHCAIPDGVFVRENGSVGFVELAPPSDDDLMAVLRRIVARLEQLLRPRLTAAQTDARPLDALGAAQAEVMHLLGTSPPETGRAKKRAAYLQGFSLHAAVHLHANDREGLAHLCGYGARPVAPSHVRHHGPGSRLRRGEACSASPPGNGTRGSQDTLRKDSRGTVRLVARQVLQAARPVA